MKLKLYSESKIKPTKTTATTVKLLKKQYPFLVDINFFQTKTTNTGDIIYIFDFDKVELIPVENTYESYFKVNGQVYKNLKLVKIPKGVGNIECDWYYIESDHWKNVDIAIKRQIIALNNKDFNDHIDSAVKTTQGIIDKLEYRIKKLRKIDWKV